MRMTVTNIVTFNELNLYLLPTAAKQSSWYFLIDIMVDITVLHLVREF